MHSYWRIMFHPSKRKTFNSIDRITASKIFYRMEENGENTILLEWSMLMKSETICYTFVKDEMFPFLEKKFK